MRKLVVTLAVLFAVPALAGPLDGVFVSNAAHCDLVAEHGVKAIYEVESEDLSIFTLEDGIMAIEYNCDPTRVDLLFDGAAAVMTAFCQEPGYEFPDLISISTYDDTQIRVTQQSAAHLSGAGDANMQGRDLYSRCSQIEELK